MKLAYAGVKTNTISYEDHWQNNFGQNNYFDKFFLSPTVRTKWSSRSIFILNTLILNLAFFV